LGKIAENGNKRRFFYPSLPRKIKKNSINILHPNTIRTLSARKGMSHDPLQTLSKWFLTFNVIRFSAKGLENQKPFGRGTLDQKIVYVAVSSLGLYVLYEFWTAEKAPVSDPFTIKNETLTPEQEEFLSKATKYKLKNPKIFYPDKRETLSYEEELLLLKAAKNPNIPLIPTTLVLDHDNSFFFTRKQTDFANEIVCYVKNKKKQEPHKLASVIAQMILEIKNI
jgi:hypothetical protein